MDLLFFSFFKPGAKSPKKTPAGALLQWQNGVLQQVFLTYALIIYILTKFTIFFYYFIVTRITLFKGWWSQGSPAAVCREQLSRFSAIAKTKCL